MIDPIEPKYKTTMNDIAHILDDILNGDTRPKTHGFVLLMFEFGHDKNMNYISNADRQDMISALKELVARFEGRTPDVVGHT